MANLDVRLAEGAEVDAGRRRLATLWGEPILMRDEIDLVLDL